MRTQQATWFECKVRYEKTLENGMQKKTSEIYVVDAINFAEAEKNVINEMSAYINGEFEVRGLKEAQYREVIFSKNVQDVNWFKVKVQFIAYNDKTGKEKFVSVVYLVQGMDISDAVRHINEFMKNSMSDYKICSVALTKIFDVFCSDNNNMEE